MQPIQGHKTKMNIEILQSASRISGTGLYETTVYEIANTKVTITKFTSVCNLKDYINVTVHNAMNRAYKGFGKQFPNVEKALEHYSNKKIQAILVSLK
jgi:metal-sulfur cluster biosynthetic enzyme